MDSRRKHEYAPFVKIHSSFIIVEKKGFALVNVQRDTKPENTQLIGRVVDGSIFAAIANRVFVSKNPSPEYSARHHANKDIND